MLTKRSERESNALDSNAESEADTYWAHRTDALVQVMADSLIGGAPSTPGDRHQVHVHVSAETLADTATPTNKVKNHVPAETLHPETIRRLACDCGLVTIIENAKGSPLSVGRETRLDNLMLLCGRHHQAVHEFGYRIEQTSEGKFEVVKSAGSKPVRTG